MIHVVREGIAGLTSDHSAAPPRHPSSWCVGVWGVWPEPLVQTGRHLWSTSSGHLCCRHWRGQLLENLWGRQEAQTSTCHAGPLCRHQTSDTCSTSVLWEPVDCFLGGGRDLSQYRGDVFFLDTMWGVKMRRQASWALGVEPNSTPSLEPRSRGSNPTRFWRRQDYLKATSNGWMLTLPIITHGQVPYPPSFVWGVIISIMLWCSHDPIPNFVLVLKSS
jgi:hypothetical protein